LALYRRAEASDRNHTGALFGLALMRERGGFDEEALELYKRAAVNYPANVGLLFNLGLLYEDLEQYDQAVICYQRILDSYPNNGKAKLFLKDAKASNNMHFDEDAKRKTDKIGQILSQPVSDFELSVRARNCLKSMGIATLGDLCKHSEHDLMASKNFGENSLTEIREMLTLKGLKLGQFSEEKQVVEVVDMDSLPVEEQEKLVRPVADLNLTVRARKCLNRLNIQTIGELLPHTSDELLKCKNFGITSLNEIREKLKDWNLKLRGE
jgi:DNA-directed RNA polymerase subunit alpha